MTRYALSAYSIGLVALILIKVLAPAFYAQKNIKTPVKIAIFTLFCTQLMNMIFIGFFGHAGLALAIALGACINAGLLFFYLIKDKVFVIEGGWIIFLIKILFGLIVMAGSLYYFKDASEMWLNYSAWEKIYNLLFLIIIGMVSYFASLKIMGINLSDFTKKISK